MVETGAQLRTLSHARRRHGLLASERRLMLAAGDLTAVCVAFVIAFNLHTAGARGAGFYVPRLGTLIVAGLWIVSASIADTYSPRAAHQMRTTLRSVLTALLVCSILLLVIFFLVPYRITRPTILIWAPLAAGLVLTGRVVYLRVFASSYFAGRIGLVITNEGLDRVWPEVHPHIGSLYTVASVIDPSRIAGGDRLRAVLDEQHVDQIVLGVRDEMDRDLFRAVLECHERGIVVRSLADLYEELTGRLLLDQLGHSWLTALPMRSETSRLYAAFKRCVDILAGLVGVTALGLVILPVAIATRLTDRGPLFHAQTRVGKYSRTFTLRKLRSMRHDPAAETRWTEAADHRITPVGRALRRLHLDELPQAWSIVRGDMSLIGPRPEQPHYVSELRSCIDFYNTRLTVRPGLTGWAQVNYGYGSGVEGTRVKLSYDLYYIKRQSASLDLIIMARTLLAVLRLRGR